MNELDEIGNLKKENLLSIIE